MDDRQRQLRTRLDAAVPAPADAPSPAPMSEEEAGRYLVELRRAAEFMPHVVADICAVFAQLAQEAHRPERDEA